MMKPEPINQAEIDEIIAKYQKKIDANPDFESVYRVQQETEVAEAIGRQRQEAITAGGALGARIQAENEAMMKEAEAMYAQISEADLAKARQAVEEMEALRKNDAPAEVPAKKIKWICKCGAVNTGKFCTECGSPKTLDRWICECGQENTGKFCTECGNMRG